MGANYDELHLKGIVGKGTIDDHHLQLKNKDMENTVGLQRDDCPSMKIPIELRGSIYTHLSQTDALNLRLVSRQLKTEIDELYIFNDVALDDHHPDDLTRKLRLKTRSCKIIRLQIPQISLFRFPNYLSNLEVDVRSISCPNLATLMAECSPYLKELTFVIPTSSTQHINIDIKSSLKIPLNYNFPNLTLLKLVNCSAFSNSETERTERGLAENMLESLVSSSPNIQTLIVEQSSTRQQMVPGLLFQVNLRITYENLHQRLYKQTNYIQVPYLGVTTSTMERPRTLDFKCNLQEYSSTDFFTSLINLLIY